MTDYSGIRFKWWYDSPQQWSDISEKGELTKAPPKRCGVTVWDKDEGTGRDFEIDESVPRPIRVQDLLSGKVGKEIK